MTKPIDDVLRDFETALAGDPADYDTLIGAFRALDVPANVSATQLTRLYTVCYRLLGIRSAGRPVDLEGPMMRWQAGHLAACAGGRIEETLFDRNATTRAWIARRRDRFIARGKPVPDGLNDDQLPARLNIPWDEETAAARIRPFLERLEENLVAAPASHFGLIWNVARDGYPVFQAIIRQWVAALEARGLGMPGTVEALAGALALYDRSEGPDPISWAACEADVLPLLDHPHPMLAAAAARYLGALYGDDCFDCDLEAPAIVDLLERLCHRGSHRAAVCGAFVCGFDTMSEGLAALAAEGSLQAVGFDLDGWVIDALAAEPHEPYLPNAQAFWFYVHEHYCADPEFVMRLIDSDRGWIAMMCATELDERVDGMRPVLERLAADPDPEIAKPAATHLREHYLNGI